MWRSPRQLIARRPWGLRAPATLLMVMEAFVYTLNHATGWFVSFLLWPVSSLKPVWGLAFLSLLTGLFMVWVFGRVSRQKAIREVRDRIRGNLLGVRLYRHDVPVVLRLQGRILRDTWSYMSLSLLPMLVLLVPIFLLLVQLNHHFGFLPLRPHDSAVVKVTFREGASLDRPLSLDMPPGVSLETPTLRIPALGEAAWRIRIDEPGQHEITLRAGDDTIPKRVEAGTGWGAVSTLRSSALTDTFFFPGEAPLSSSSDVVRFEVAHQPLVLHVFGIELHWLTFFLIVSIASAFIFKRPLGVEL